MEKLTFYIDCDDTIFNSGQVVRKFLTNNGLKISENEDPYELYYNLYPEERNNPKFQCLYDMQEIYPVFDELFLSEPDFPPLKKAPEFTVDFLVRLPIFSAFP